MDPFYPNSSIGKILFYRLLLKAVGPALEFIIPTVRAIRAVLIFNCKFISINMDNKMFFNYLATSILANVGILLYAFKSAKAFVAHPWISSRPTSKSFTPSGMGSFPLIRGIFCKSFDLRGIPPFAGVPAGGNGLATRGEEAGSSEASASSTGAYFNRTLRSFRPLQREVLRAGLSWVGSLLLHSFPQEGEVGKPPAGG